MTDGKSESVDSLKDVANALVTAVTAIAPKQYVKFGQQDLKTPFNPTGKRNRKLKRTMFQNGNRLNERVLSDQEIALLDQLVPGRYIEGLITVIEKDNGNNEKTVYIQYKNKTVDQRQNLQTYASTFTAQLQRMVDEARESLESAQRARTAEVKAALARS